MEIPLISRFFQTRASPQNSIWGGSAYSPIGVQRNYAAHKAVAVEVHLIPEELAKEKIKTSGWEVKHVWRC